MKSRRQVLRVVAGATVLPVLPSSAASYSPKVLHADEMRLLSVLVDLIIPRTNTPGANDAGVPVWIDEALSADVALRSRFRNGLDWLNAEARNQFQVPFTELSEHNQASLLTPLAREAAEIITELCFFDCPSKEPSNASDGARFFILLKDMTIDAYYASREGLVAELGYQGNTHLVRFEGCTHREHQ
jgi:gluconate 2-dehydrogenase gamma chain